MNSSDRMQHGPPHAAHPHPQSHGPPPPMNNFSNNYESYHKQSTSQTNLNNFTNFSNSPSGVVSVQAPSTVSTHQRLNSASMNTFENSQPPVAAAPTRPPLQRQSSGSGGGPMGFNVTPDQLVRPSRAVVKDDKEMWVFKSKVYKQRSFNN